jgi:transposase InsO family protein
MEAIPLAAIATADSAHALFFHWIVCFGVPATITSDHGPQFNSSLLATLCKILNILHHHVTAYHPEANGAVENLHRRLKDALHA